MNNEHDAPEQPADPAPEPRQPEPPAPAARPEPPQPPHTESAKFFQWLRGLGVQRGRNRWMGGVCSGLADKWGIDPVIVRGLAVVLTLFFGIGLLAYGVAWALLPEPDGRIHVEEVARGRWTSGMTGAGALTVLGLAGPGQSFFFDRNDGWFFWPLFWIAAVAGFGYWLATRDKPKSAGMHPGRQGHQGHSGTASHTDGGTGNPTGPDTPARSWYGHTWESGAYGGYGASDAPGSGPTTAAPSAPSAPMPAPAMMAQGQAPYVQQPFAPHPQMYVKTAPRPPKPRLGAAASLLVLGLAAVVGALVLILDAANIIDLGGYQAGMAAAAAAITTGLGIIAAGFAGRTAGGLGTFSIIFLIFAGLLSLPNSDHAAFTAFNHTDWVPATSTAAESGRTVVMGNATFDLTQLDDAPLAADVDIPLKSVASNITVKVPSGIPVTVRSELVAVSFSIDGKNDGGVLTQDSTRDINPDATGNGLVITLEGVASNINFVPVAGP